MSTVERIVECGHAWRPLATVRATCDMSALLTAPFSYARDTEIRSYSFSTGPRYGPHRPRALNVPPRYHPVGTVVRTVPYRLPHAGTGTGVRYLALRYAAPPPSARTETGPGDSRSRTRIARPREAPKPRPLPTRNWTPSPRPTRPQQQRKNRRRRPKHGQLSPPSPPPPNPYLLSCVRLVVCGVWSVGSQAL